MKQTAVKALTVTSNAFVHEGVMPVRCTGRGENMSPGLDLSGISTEAVSMAVIMDDLDIPLVGVLNHWVIWNLPVQSNIPENIPHGRSVSTLAGAVQGIGYGKHRYRGPKPPFFIKSYHRYQFHIYLLDCTLQLGSNARKRDLLKAMDGHILQYGSLLGKFRNG